MGYYTTFNLSCGRVDLELEKEIFTKLKSISGYDLRRDYEKKWYKYKEDMLMLSKLYSDILFTLEGEGEESGDVWKYYFKNGKSQRCNAIITFDKFDKTKLV